MCFPEILEDEFLYEDYQSLEQKLKDVIWKKNYVVPKIKCQNEIDSFFTNIVNEMIH